MSEIALLGVDWGSSSARAFAIAPDGAIAGVRRSDDGVFAASGAFDERLRRLLGDWLERWPAAPILLCGMIGSDRGWVHAPYTSAPAGLDDLARALIAAPFARTARIVPGMSFVAGETCEVMRGEETLLMGLAATRATLCLPGTHSKWVDLIDGHVTAFRTHMTGELRAALLAAGALATPVPQSESAPALAAGLATSQHNAALTQSLFQARARRLLGTLATEHTASFVSGVLIGAEIASEAETGREGPIVLAARGALAEAYGAALSQAGLAFTIVDPEPLAARGLLRIARRAGLSPNGPT